MDAALGLDTKGRQICPEIAISAICEHALKCYPQESVGYLDGHGIYFPLRNVSTNPEKYVQIDKRLFAGLLSEGKIAALVHSHPGGPDCPSQQDMESQVEMALPFVIVATNGQACARPFIWGDELSNRLPLIGRPFRHGVSDCYALIRDWCWAEHGVDLPDFPRGWEWWNDKVAELHGLDTDLYRDNFAKAGFVEADRVHPLPGDVWLAAVRSKTPNHAGVYLGDGLALHHPSSGLAHDPARLSKREPLARWSPYLTHWLRRSDIAANSSPSRQAGQEIREKA